MKYEKYFGAVKVEIERKSHFPDIFFKLSTGAGCFKVRVSREILRELKEFLEEVLREVERFG